MNCQGRLALCLLLCCSCLYSQQILCLEGKIRKRLKDTDEKSIKGGQSDLKFAKIAKKSFAIKKVSLRRDFEAELRVLAAMKSNKFVLQPVLTDNEFQEIVFRRVGGKDLYQLDNIKAISYHNLIDISRQIVTAVDLVHQLGYLHLDVKPENILHEAGKIWLIDFGLAHEIKNAPREIGTPRTMAPEMISADSSWMPVITAVDWWSVGVTLFHLFSKHFELPNMQHFDNFPYRIAKDVKNPLAQWPIDYPNFPILLNDLLYGEHGLLSYDYRNRQWDGKSLLEHPFFSSSGAERWILYDS